MYTFVWQDSNSSCISLVLSSNWYSIFSCILDRSYIVTILQYINQPGQELHGLNKTKTIQYWQLERLLHKITNYSLIAQHIQLWPEMVNFNRAHMVPAQHTCLMFVISCWWSSVKSFICSSSLSQRSCSSSRVCRKYCISVSNWA